MNLEQIYQRLPISVQNAVCSLEGLRLGRRRYGGGYEAIEREVAERNLRDEAAMRALQGARLQAHLETAATSPYWQHAFKRHGVLPVRDPFDALAKLPIMDKAVARAEVDAIRNPGIAPSDLQSCHTSGTTGGGLRFFETRIAEQERWAVWWRYRGWHGITRDTRCGYFGGRSVVPVDAREPPYWRVNRPGRQVMFSAYHLGRKTVDAYIAGLQQYAPEWLHGYPSVLALLAGLIADGARAFTPAQRIVTTGAENLLSAQRRVIEDTFAAPVRQHYGQAEAVANFSECAAGTLHVDEDFSFVEFIPIDQPGDLFRVIGSNWTNPAFPLLRYDTGDVVRLGAGGCPCGRIGRSVLAVDGRQEDYVTLPGGARLGRLDHIFKDLVNVREAQIFQPDVSQLVFRVVKGPAYGADDERMLLHEAAQRLGAEIKLSIDYVDAIERTPTGKLRFVISRVQ